MDKWGRKQPEISQVDEYEDLRFLLINTKRIFEISKEDAAKVKIFEELKKMEEKC